MLTTASYQPVPHFSHLGLYPTVKISRLRNQSAGVHDPVSYG
jgi:hypothetical protein